MTKLCPLCGLRFTDGTRFCPTDGQALRDENTSDPLVGMLVAKRYLIERKIGEGGMGTVYEAVHVTMDRRVALKVLHMSRLAVDRDAMLRFSREASNASKLSHANVASVYDFGDAPEQDLVYLAMELVEGESLGALLQREGALSPRRAASIAFQIADALTAAHEQGVIHRDLKPDNVMLTRRADGSDVVKVVDFGISRVMDSATQQVTSTGMAIGTPAYMSPEQLRADPIDARTDVFALGLICYRMLSGQLPWATVNRDEILVQRMLHPRRALAEIRPDVEWPVQLQEVLDFAIAIDVTQRYAAAMEVAADLLVVIQRWVPDTPGAPAPWDRRLRVPTPTGNMRQATIDGMGGDMPPAPPTPRGATEPNAGRVPGAGAGTFPAGLDVAQATAAAVGASDGPVRQGAARRIGARGYLAISAVVLATTATVLWLKWPAKDGDQSATEMLTKQQIAQRDSTSRAQDGSGAGAVGTPGKEVVLASPAIKEASGTTPPGQAGSRAKGDAAAKTDLGKRAIAPVNASPPSGSGVGATADSAEVMMSPSAVHDALQQMAAYARPDATPADARNALQLMTRLLPRLPSDRDRVEAQLRGAEAYLVLDQPEKACRLLLSIERAAAGTPLRANVAVYLDDAELACRTR